jgi:D-3-phosphoglycerate dehydrogenase / 2-oxoglutarate reductase
VVKGLLKPICGDSVNFINALAVAKERGIAVAENRSDENEGFVSFIEVEVVQGQETHRIMGTLFSNQPRIVRLNEFMIDVVPEGWVLFVKNDDLPGVVGMIGTVLGKNGVNIAEMSLGRVGKGKKAYAMTAINTDSEVPAKVVALIKKNKLVLDVKVVKL